MSPNYSVYSIPLYYLLTLFPHTYSIALITRATRNAKSWDNRNPRGSSQSQSLQKSLSPPTYTKYERARACHNNGIENMPLFLAAVILGNMAGLGNGTLNWSCAGFLGFRVLYTVAYIQVERRRMSYLRTAAWLGAVGVCMGLIIRAGTVIAGREGEE